MDYQNIENSITQSHIVRAKSPSSFSQEMLQALLANGFTKSMIAEKIRASYPTINRILYGRGNPGTRIFSNLLSLYCATKLNETVFAKCEEA